MTKDAVKFLRAWSNADAAGRQRIRARWPELSLAMGAYMGADLLAAQLEARLLAREPDEVIAQKVGVSVETVKIFEAMYFNVANSREAHDWLLMYAVGVVPGMGRVPSERDIWCYCALAGGPLVVDLLVNDVLDGSNRRDRLLAEKARFLARDHAAGGSPQASAEFLAEGRRLFRSPRQLAGGGTAGRLLEQQLRAVGLTPRGKKVRRAASEEAIRATQEREKLAAQFWAKYGGIVTRPKRGAASGAEAIAREESAGKVRNDSGCSVAKPARKVTGGADRAPEAEAILAAAMTHGQPHGVPATSPATPWAGEALKLPRAAPAPASAHGGRGRANPRRDGKRRAA
jgi:hypothetical protein